MSDVFGLYPQAPNNQQNLLANPAQAINALQGLTLLQRQQMELQGQRAFGQIYSRHITPDGVDIAGVLQDAARDPAASLVLPQYTTGALAQKGQMINNAQQYLALSGAQIQPVFNYLSSLGPNATADQVRSAITTGKRMYPSVPGDIWTGAMHTILDHPDGIPAGIGVAQNLIMSPEARAARVPMMLPTGQAVTEPMSAVNISGGAVPSSLPTGSQELMAGGAQRALTLENTANTTSQYHADLDNLLTDSQIIGQKSGVTIEAEKKLNETLQRFGIPGLTLSPSELGASESFDKITNQIASNQAQVVGAGTDAGRNMVLGATPALSQSQYGREGIIAMLQGNQDFIDHMRKMWLASPMHNVPGSFNQFVSEMVTPSDPNRAAVDPRVFQFNRMNPAERQTFLNAIRKSGQLAEFEKRYKYAADPAQGWVPALQQQTPPSGGVAVTAPTQQ